MARFSQENLRNDLLAALLELVGTTLFLLLGLGGIQASTRETLASPHGVSDVQQVIITGSLFNPCITASLVMLGILPLFRGFLYCIAQFVGSIAAAAILRGLTGPLTVNTVLNPETSRTQGLIIEMFITCALVIAVLMLAAEKHQATAFAPVGIGLTLYSCHLFAVNYTGASMNTARSFGPAVISGFSSSDHWIYWVGPFMGSVLGSAFYAACKHYKYWTLNPHQDTDDYTKSPDNPVIIAKAIIEERNLTLNPRVIVNQISDRIPKLSIPSGSGSSRGRSNSTLVEEGGVPKT
ncbi:unnamed protein product [Mycena citricolor]|uniref:Uncharacterized protein n=1 Tax=Mycena citricolor TaxID=2018698 RepID=A0AAD2H5T1_9AGAR|nr:unnamed protein product [Mycena citricolor]